MTATPGRRGARTGVRAVVVAGAAGLLLSACGTSAPQASPGMAARATGPGTPTASVQQVGTASAQVGALHVHGAYIPQQASPDVAAAYLQVTNTGSTADALVSASSPAAQMVMLHETVTDGTAESMVPLAALPVPAHGTVALTAGHRHLMLMSPPAMLRQGAVVPLTVHFARAGDLTLMVPVVGFTGPQDRADQTPPAPGAGPGGVSAGSSGGPGMPGMSGGG